MSDMSQAEYARHRGVTRQAISKLVAQGKIPLTKQGRINPADADFALGTTQERAVAREPATDAPAPRSESGLNKAKTAEAFYDARIKQLKFEQMRGNLIPTAEVVEAAITCSETMIRAFDRITSRAEEFVGKDVFAARAVLKQIERELRAAASTAFERMAAQAKRAAAASVPQDEDEAD